MFFRNVFVHTAGPNTALIKSSGRKDVNIVIGGRMLAIPLIQRVDILSLKLRTITVHTTRGTTINGVGVDVTSCCQVKIQGWSTKPENSTHASTRHETRSAGGDLHMDYSAIRLAAQHFIGKKDEEIEESIQKTISGHQRAIIGVLTVEQLYKERATFSKRVLDLCYDDMRNMGLTVVSYTVAEITDDHGYIEALGVTQTEFVKRTASEGAALHQSKAASNKAQQDALAHLEVNMQTEKKIQSDKLRAITEAKAQEEINRRVAVQEKAHDIAAAEQDAILLVKKQEARAAEAKAELLVAKEHVEKERLLKQQRVNTEADAKLYEAKVQAEGVRATTRAEADKLRDLGEANAAAAAAQIRLTGVAKADAQEEYIRRDGRAQAEAIREIGLAKVTVAKAEAEAIRAKGNAEMEILEKRLQLFKEHGNQAILIERMIEALPKIASAVAEPLSKTEKMVFVGSGQGGGGPSAFTREMNRIVAEVPETMLALTGLDLRNAFGEAVKGKTGDAAVQGAFEGVATSVTDKLMG